MRPLLLKNSSELVLQVLPESGAAIVEGSDFKALPASHVSDVRVMSVHTGQPPSISWNSAQASRPQRRERCCWPLSEQLAFLSIRL